MKKTVESINKKIGPYDQKIVEYLYGLNSLHYYCFISTAKTSISKLQNVYSEQELDYFKLILNKIIENTEVFITPRDALNLSAEVPNKLLKIRAQVLLEKWLSSSYFFKHTDDKIYLGPKILNEFKELIQRQEVEYIKSCSLCDDIAIWVTTTLITDNIYSNLSYFRELDVINAIQNSMTLVFRSSLPEPLNVLVVKIHLPVQKRDNSYLLLINYHQYHNIVLNYFHDYQNILS